MIKSIVMETPGFLEIYGKILLSDFLRYFIPASIAFISVWMILKKKLAHKFIQKIRPDNKKLWFEFRYSMSTVLIFASVGLCIYLGKDHGIFHIYGNINEFGWIYFVCSLGFMVIFHDAYFYWTHRWMHHPKIFRHVHLVHHLSTNPSPWAAYSFHPIEAFVQAMVLPIILFIIPAHNIIIFVFLIYMITRNVWGHLGYELLPKKFLKIKWLNFHTTTTHHSMHHQYSKCNYGLYFIWWDNWMKTTHKKYEESFEEVASRKSGRSCKIKCLVILLSTLVSIDVIGQSPTGKWMTFNEATGMPLSVISIRENLTNQTFEGVIDSVIVPDYVGEKGRCTFCTGDKKNKPLIGLEFLWNFKLDGKSWVDGKIIDPESGTIYDSKIWFANDDSIYVRGYGGIFNLFYRTQIWQRKTGNGIAGIWETIDDRFHLVKSEVELKVIQNELKGFIRKIFLMPYEGNYPICTECEGDLKNKPIVGMEFMSGFVSHENEWVDGKILDPGNGNVYSGKFWLKGENTLVIRGYWGPFFRTQEWKRFESP